MQYLRIEGESFGFVDDLLQDILETDIPITKNEYELFFKRQAAGENFKLKNTDGSSHLLFDLIENYEPEQKKYETSYRDLASELKYLQDKMTQLESRINNYTEV